MERLNAMETNKESLLTDDFLWSKIYVIRGVQIMLDCDLATIYGYSTKRFNEQVKNNIERFDESFRFQLTDSEFKNLKSKNSASSWGGTRHLPYAFTEEGIYMLIDAGKRITSITCVEDVMLYRNIVTRLQNNPPLEL